MRANKCGLCSGPAGAAVFSTANTHGRHMIDARESFPLIKCEGCGVFYLGGISVDDDYYKKYYDTGYYDSAINESSLLGRALAFLGRWSIRKKERLITGYIRGSAPISLLDVGCGGGVFLSNLNPAKFDRQGLEINEEGCELCRRKGLVVHNKKLNEMDSRSHKYSVVTLWHVLEHIEKPRELLEAARKILSDDGIMVVQVPNTDSVGFKCGKQSWFHMDSPRHLMLYNRKSMAKLCELTGFRIVETKNEFYDYPQDLFWSVRKSPLKYFIYPLYPLFRMLSAEHLTFVLKKA